MPPLSTPVRRAIDDAPGQMLPPGMRDMIDDQLADGVPPDQLSIVIARLVPSSAYGALLHELCDRYIDRVCERHGAADAIRWTIPEVELAARNAPN